MKIRRIRTRRDFDTLAPIWEDLARESGQVCPFLSHDWFGCCWSSAGPSRQPEVLLVEDTAGPVALVPLMRSVQRLRGWPLRRIGMLTAPDTPFVDWLIAGRAEPVIDAVMRDLEGARDWDLISLGGLPGDSQTAKDLAGWLEGRQRCLRGRSVRAPYVALDRPWAAYWASKSQRFKKTVRSVRNRLLRAGAVSIEEHREVSPASSVFADMVEVSGRSWKAEHGLAVATMPGMREFFRELTDRASARGWLRLWLLRLDGRPVATEYQLESDGRVHALRADFDASLPEDLSPGTYLSGEILKTLFERRGAREYDMGPGENPYKSRWMTDARETVEFRVFRPGAYGGLLRTIETRVAPAVRRLLGREPS